MDASPLRLTVIEGLPEGLLGLPAHRLHEGLPGPALIHLPGRREPPLFVSVLLHGNEPVGWEAVRRLLAARRTPLPRALTLFVGNVAAARLGLRRLPGQVDYNRAWPGGEHAHRPEGRLLAEVVERMRRRGVFASVDLHANTGCNPRYACVNRLDPPFLHLAALFSRTVVHFLRPRGVQSMAFAELCPAVTAECGKVGDPGGVRAAQAYLEACLRLAEVPAHPVPSHDLELFHTVATVRIPEEVPFAVGENGDPEARVLLPADLDRWNFQELLPGTPLVQVRKGGRLEVVDETGRDATRRYLQREGEHLVLRRAVMPAMLTLERRIIRQDCLCYFMERLDPYRALAEAGRGPQAQAGGAA